MISRQGEEVEIDTWLDCLPTYFGPTDERSAFSLSTRQVITWLSNQYGAAHEDWDLDHRLAELLFVNVLVGGVPPHVRTITRAGAAVFRIANEFMDSLDVETIDAVDLSS